PHRLFRGGIGFVAQPLVREKLARHDKAGSLAGIGQARTLARVYRVDHRLVDADGERAANLRKPWISSVPVPGDDEIRNLLLSAGQGSGRHAGPQVLASLEQFRQSDVGIVRPAHDPTRLLGSVVDTRLLGVHVGAVDDRYARHGISPALKSRL